MKLEIPVSPTGPTGPSGQGAMNPPQILAVIQQLRIVYRAMQEHSRWVERQCGVSAAQLWALGELATHPDASVSELSQALALHQSTTSNLLDKLEKKGLVERRRGGPDQRVVRVRLNDAGRDVVARAPRSAQGAIAAALARLPDAELANLEHALAELIDRMDGADHAVAMLHMTDE